MGGNALSKPSIRLPKDKFSLLSRDLVAKSQTYLLDSRVAEVIAYYSKESFGDLDLIVGCPNSAYDRQALAKHLGATEIQLHASKSLVTSFGVQTDMGVFQVDLLKVSEKGFNYACQYYAFNDLGNLLGRIAHKFGCKHGYEGLLLPVRVGDYLVEEITLTQDYAKALEFMGYTFEDYRSGFYTPTEIFEFVSSSKYFNPEIYLLHNRNHKARVRDAKRKTYQEFLAWCEKLPKTESYEFSSTKADYLGKIFEFFPEAKLSYESVLDRVNHAAQAKVKFNGILVGVWTGLEGKELGGFMTTVRERFSELDFDPAEETGEEVKNLVMNVYENWKK